MAIPLSSTMAYVPLIQQICVNSNKAVRISLFPVMVYKNKRAVASRPASGIRHSSTNGGLPHWNYTNLFNFIIIEKGQWCPAPPVALDIAALAADYPTGINTYLYNFYYHLHQQTTTKQTIKYNAMYELLIAIHVLHLLS